MAEKKDNAVTKPALQAQGKVVYTVEDFKAAAKKLFGYGPEVIAGAVYGKEKETYTLEEMKNLVNAFLDKPVKAEKEGN